MTQSVVISEKVQLTDEIVQFTFANNQDTPLAPFEAGAHIDIFLLPEVTRQYSLFNAWHHGEEYKIAIKMEMDGRGGSKHICKTFKVGDEVTVSNPRNHFALEKSARHYILMGGGIGITPVISLAEQLIEQGDASFELHYFARSEQDAAFSDYLNQERFNGRVFTHWDDGPEEQKLDLADKFAAVQEQTQIYMCGPQGFMSAIENACQHWPEGSLKQEHFASAVSSDAPKDPFNVRLQKSNIDVSVAENQSLSEALKEHGIIVNISCSEGVCGECLCNVVSGDIDHRDTVLTDAEKKSNSKMTPCVSRAKGDSLIVLDL